LLAGAPPVKSGDRVSFHHYSSEARAVLRILEGKVLRGGETARVQLRLLRPVAAAPGDRFVVRRLSPVETIGGGVVLDPLWPPVRRATPEVLADLGRLDGSLAERLPARGSSRGPEEGAGRNRSPPGRGEPRRGPGALSRSRPRAQTGARLAIRRNGTSGKKSWRLAVRARAEIEKGIHES
jgi:hypothetical protein